MVLNPGVIVGLLSSESLRHVFFYHALKEFFRLMRVSGERLVIEMEIAFNDISDDFQL